MIGSCHHSVVVCLSVTLCIVVLKVSVVVWGVKICTTAFLAGHFVFTSSDTCCRMYRLATTHSVMTDEGQTAFVVMSSWVVLFNRTHAAKTEQPKCPRLE